MTHVIRGSPPLHERGRKHQPRAASAVHTKQSAARHARRQANGSPAAHLRKTLSCLLPPPSRKDVLTHRMRAWRQSSTYEPLSRDSCRLASEVS
jgi:hypothetical protein